MKKLTQIGLLAAGVAFSVSAFAVSPDLYFRPPQKVAQSTQVELISCLQIGGALCDADQNRQVTNQLRGVHYNGLAKDIIYPQGVEAITLGNTASAGINEHYCQVGYNVNTTGFVLMASQGANCRLQNNDPYGTLYMDLTDSSK